MNYKGESRASTWTDDSWVTVEPFAFVGVDMIGESWELALLRGWVCCSVFNKLCWSNLQHEVSPKRRGSFGFGWMPDREWLVRMCTTHWEFSEPSGLCFKTGLGWNASLIPSVPKLVVQGLVPVELPQFALGITQVRFRRLAVLWDEMLWTFMKYVSNKWSVSSFKYPNNITELSCATIKRDVSLVSVLSAQVLAPCTTSPWMRRDERPPKPRSCRVITCWVVDPLLVAWHKKGPCGHILTLILTPNEPDLKKGAKMDLVVASGHLFCKNFLTFLHQKWQLGGWLLWGMCGDSDACSICNADGSVLGIGAVPNMTALMTDPMSILSQWPVATWRPDGDWKNMVLTFIVKFSTKIGCQIYKNLIFTESDAQKTAFLGTQKIGQGLLYVAVP